MKDEVKPDRRERQGRQLEEVFIGLTYTAAERLKAGAGKALACVSCLSAATVQDYPSQRPRQTQRDFIRVILRNCLLLLALGFFLGTFAYQWKYSGSYISPTYTITKSFGYSTGCEDSKGADTVCKQDQKQSWNSTRVRWSALLTEGYTCPCTTDVRLGKNHFEYSYLFPCRKLVDMCFNETANHECNDRCNAQNDNRTSLYECQVSCPSPNATVLLWRDQYCSDGIIGYNRPSAIFGVYLKFCDILDAYPIIKLPNVGQLKSVDELYDFVFASFNAMLLSAKERLLTSLELEGWDHAPSVDLGGGSQIGRADEYITDELRSLLMRVLMFQDPSGKEVFPMGGVDGYNRDFLQDDSSTLLSLIKTPILSTPSSRCEVNITYGGAQSTGLDHAVEPKLKHSFGIANIGSDLEVTNLNRRWESIKESNYIFADRKEHPSFEYGCRGFGTGFNQIDWAFEQYINLVDVCIPKECVLVKQKSKWHRLVAIAGLAGGLISLIFATALPKLWNWLLNPILERTLGTEAKEEV